MINETNPLMIRGDRLLLALDVIAYRGGEGANRSFSEDRIDTVLQRFGCRDADITDTVMEIAHAFESLHRFCAENIGSHRDDMFTVRDLIDMTWEVSNEVMRTALDQMFSVIASGELTEADFQEVT